MYLYIYICMYMCIYLQLYIYIYIVKKAIGTSAHHFKPRMLQLVFVDTLLVDLEESWIVLGGVCVSFVSVFFVCF